MSAFWIIHIDLIYVWQPPVAQQDTLERSKSQEQELTEKGAAALDVPPEGLTSAAESQREEEGAPGEHTEEDKPKEKVKQNFLCFDCAANNH